MIDPVLRRAMTFYFENYKIDSVLVNCNHLYNVSLMLQERSSVQAYWCVSFGKDAWNV